MNNDNITFKTIGIIGVGLLGGSIGLAIKKATAIYTNTKIIGIGRDESKLKAAKLSKAIDTYHTMEYLESVKNCDLVIIATPVSKILEIFNSISPYLNPQAIVTDVGSTKQVIVSEIEQTEKGKQQFVGSHPMAGSEKTGVENADSGLYQKSTVVVTQSKQTNIALIAKIKAFWMSLGATQVLFMSPEEHDEIVAYTSHLPHIVASILCSTLKTRFNTNTDMETIIYGNGFLDTTRIAKGDPSMWSDIIKNNKNSITVSIRTLKKKLELFEAMLKKNEYSKIEDYLLENKLFRKQFKEKTNKVFGEVVYEG